MAPAASTASPSVSLIICTYNRAESLRRTLQTCCDLVIPAGITWELLVVDNNSTDHTKQVCESFAGTLPLRYLFEAKQGLSAARNRGIRESRGEFLVFTDDDVDVDAHFLSTLWQAAVKQPQASLFGGRIIPQWDTPPPRWFVEPSTAALLAGVSVHYDQGEDSRYLERTDIAFFGANMAFRKKALNQPQPFREDLGLSGNIPTRQEETALIRQLLQNGHKAYYVSDALVHHRNCGNRMTERYVRDWFKGAGISEVRINGSDEMARRWLRAPRYLWRRLIESACRYALTRYTRPSAVWLRHEITMARTWGMITEFRRQARMQKVLCSSTSLKT